MNLQNPNAAESGIWQFTTTLDAVLGHATLTVGDLMHLRRGATILLEEKLSDPVTVYAGTVPVCEGRVYSSEGHFVIHIDKSWVAGQGE